MRESRPAGHSRMMAWVVTRQFDKNLPVRADADDQERERNQAMQKHQACQQLAQATE